MGIEPIDFNSQFNINSTIEPKINQKNKEPLWNLAAQNKNETEPDKSQKSMIALSKGYTQTPNTDIYYNEKDETYYRWNEKKNKFTKAKDIKTVLKTGYCTTKDGSFLTPEGELFVKNKNTYLEPQHDIVYNIPNVMADVYGLEHTGKKFVFYDKEQKCYKIWDNDKQQFTISEISDVTNDSYYKIGDKYYDSLNNETTQSDFYASKNGYIKSSKEANVYVDSKAAGIYYKWNQDTKTFEKFGPKVEMLKLLNEETDGIINNTKQGKLGDCWLLSSVHGIAKHNSQIFKDIIKIAPNGDVTINLLGAKRSYTMSKNELDNAIKQQKYSTGDKDMVAIELAFEKFRKENIANGKANVNNRYNLCYLSGYSESDYLYGGQPKNAIEVLTGKKVNTLSNTGNNQFHFENNVVKMGKISPNELLEYTNKPDNTIIISLDETGPHGQAHAYLYDSQDEQNFYLIDTMDTSKTQAFDKKYIYSKLLSIDYTDFSEPVDEKIANAVSPVIVLSPEVKDYLDTKKN